MRISFIGTRGVPASYGGFETAVEEIGQRMVAMGHEVVVYCRPPTPHKAEHRGMRLVHLPAFRRKSLETLSHTGLSVAHAVLWRPPDVALVFNAANAPLLPLFRLRRTPTAIHVDGLEWRRSKWGRIGRSYYLLSERLATRLAGVLIADSSGIQDYYRSRYAVDTERLVYGAPILKDVADDRLAELGLESGGYHLVVARLEPENNVDIALAGVRRSHAALPMVVVGSAPYSNEHIALLHGEAAADDRIRMVGGVYDQELLNQLYAHCCSYVHGHSVGGTNPSLLRAMGAGAPVLALDVVFNREVAGDQGRYYTGPADLAALLEEAEAAPDEARTRGSHGRRLVADRYIWDEVAAGYERLCQELFARRPDRRRPASAP